MLNTKNLPSLSVVIVAKNCQEMLRKCLNAINRQDYPAEKIEVLVLDGGSTDNTCGVAEELGAIAIDGGYSDNPEARRHVGVLKAKHDIIVVIDTDNILPYESWLKDMARPLADDSEIVGCFTKWYGYDQNTAGLDQYYALVGGNDTVAFYLGKNDRVPYLLDKLPGGARHVVDRGGYEVVEFEADRLPVVGSNGFFVRRDALIALNYQDPNEYLHIDVNVDIIQKLGRKRYAIVKTTMVHLTGETLQKNVNKRINYMKTHFVGLSEIRRYKVFDSSKKRDVFRLLLTVLFTFTFVEPLIRAIQGYIRTGNRYWFYHPVVAFVMSGAYAVSFIRKVIKI